MYHLVLTPDPLSSAPITSSWSSAYPVPSEPAETAGALAAAAPVVLPELTLPVPRSHRDVTYLSLRVTDTGSFIAQPTARLLAQGRMAHC